MDEILTVAELRSRYQGEWVLLTDLELDEHRRVRAGRVVAHDTDREKVYSAGFSVAPPRHLAALCFKEPEPGTAVAF